MKKAIVIPYFGSMYYNFFFSFNSGCKSTGGRRADGGAYPGAAPGGARREAEGCRRGAADVYVSNEGTEEDDGATAETPTTLARATELANEGKKPVEIVVLGQVSVDTWTSPL